VVIKLFHAPFGGYLKSSQLGIYSTININKPNYETVLDVYSIGFLTLCLMGMLGGLA